MRTGIFLPALAASLLAACGGGGGGDDIPANIDNKIEADITNNHGPQYRTVEIRLANGQSFSKIDSATNRGHIDNSVMPRGFSQDHAAQFLAVANDGTSISENTTLRGYRGSYSSMFVSAPLQQAYPGTSVLDRETGAPVRTTLQTDTFDIPMSGQFSYQGYAFNNDPAFDARLDYTIDYGRRVGFGEISPSRAQGRQILAEASIREHFTPVIGHLEGYGVKQAEVRDVAGKTIGAYSFLIAGPNAEEIAGEIEYGIYGINTKPLYFHGTR